LHPEAFGIVAAEAMASGLALVSTGVGGAAELFDDGISGLAYPAGDAAALAERLAQLAADPALLTRLQHNGQQRVRERFSVTTAAQQLEALLH
jgi:glycosyltransferase involved in cell wall biosynthesis